MNKIFFLAMLAIMTVFGLSGLPSVTKAESLESKLSGRVLLAVESHGETWYLSPGNERRYFLKDATDTLDIMKQLGLGISNTDFDSFDNKAPMRLSGKILLKVQNRGEAYYVNPVDLKMHYLGTPDQALKLMQSLSLGISDFNLAKISTSENVNVSITNYGFSPANITVNKGTVITWTNYSNISQTITSPNHFNFGELDSGEKYSHVFNDIGTYNYYSINQSAVMGSVIVK